ncbi:DUF2960 domain-containing protein [Shewanella pneumatophori]|uniref:DUF2960 domain-containing protein n=1 Tax=Shewanella pneumatophori TaxID=314092 RepID=A0A9X2CHU5_9GAMM|nr:DUF2960 domain-containing protein [Shewanella pneumatophori]MCL1138769.1 DUF2960 domain-containing protein [Shewanella pneumatophori]
MATRITYKFKNQAKEINFAYDKYHDIYEAVAAAEGVDLTRYLMMEQQIAMTSKGSSAVKDFRAKEFARFGFSDIYYHKDEPKKP